MDALIALSALLPGVAATPVAMHRARRSSFVNAHPPAARAALVALSMLLLGACHSIDRDAFAHSPVPLATLPFREPLAYSLGAQSGQVVPFQHGLLASYFAGAQYDRLDHQQIDPTVDFTWDATGNPVISAPDGIDYNEGDFRLPDSWGIWSVVWEGYLIAPADGTYLLRIHVNNGGWLEMKTPSGALTTVIDCAGGTSFEGDCDASTTLAAGPNYIRYSWYNNAPPSAVARLLWQPPGAAAVTLVPTEALAAQASQSRNRAFIYVHGWGGSLDQDDFPTFLDTLKRSYTRINFRYYEDHAFANPDLTCHPVDGSPGQRTFELTHDQIQAAFPFTIDPFDPAPGICDSNDDIELNAVLLDADIVARAQPFDGITLVANSGGGAIVRAYLAYATATHSLSLDKLDAVFLLEGVEHGTFLEATGQDGGPVADNPVLRLVRSAISDRLRGTMYDTNRPAAQDFIPQTDLISFYNRADVIPSQPHYVNVAGDIVVHVKTPVFGVLVPSGDVSLGDGVMVPGRDNPSELPLPAAGGARFLPSTILVGASSTQWVLHKEYVVVLGASLPGDVGAVVNDPAVHQNLSRMNEICVTVPSGGVTTVKRLDAALLDAFRSLDTLPADPQRIGFGNLQRVNCP